MEVLNIDFGYGGRQVFQDFSFTASPGCLTTILGKSGVGKSTLLKLIAGIHQPQAGSISHRGQPVRACTLSCVFQEPRLLPWKTARENIEYVLLNRLEREQRRHLSLQLLHQTGLEQDAHCYPHELSGGMCQRVSLARAFALSPDILLLDEPFQALDVATRNAMHRLFLQLFRQYQPTTVMVTHDPEEALALADEIAVFAYQPVFESFRHTLAPATDSDQLGSAVNTETLRQRLRAEMGDVEESFACRHELFRHRIHHRRTP
ncbi:ATP-binding cassette domain-containing protein [Desulfurispirillum indicum]|uniref:ABC transporter ATP-binding protein n=1 Tax=Desulfurispirillum indicum TaxID=936456 RepID=UPI001CFA4052|nr:ATP-binding cassette domain-containing protein [Desulfurispirillum indicum]UCZ57309.1 ATP-binding cassette domain-containing protein [Desulfurispirillum indicum]